MKAIFFSFSMVITFYSAIAQPGDDPCRDVLLYAGNNTSIETKNAFLAKSIYDQHCQGTSVSGGTSFGLDLPTKLGKLGLSGGSTREKLVNLCKTYDSRYAETVSTYSYQRTASEAAIDAWIKCQMLNRSGVLINPTVANEQLLINVRQSGSPVTIQGVRTTGFEKCESTIKGNSKTVDKNFTHTVKNGNHVQIVCQRSITQDDNGRYFKPASLTLGTSKGPFAITLVDDIYPNLTTVREVNTRIDELTKSTVHPDNNYLRIGDLQICWGSQVIDPKTSKPHHVANFEFSFPKPFTESPKIMNSIDADGSGWVYSVYNYDLTNSKYNGIVVENVDGRIPNKPLLVKFDYMAIGKWK